MNMTKFNPLRMMAKPVRSLRKPLSILWLTIREIFDENAYERYLQAARLNSSPQAYARFIEERAVTQSRRPRCC